MACARIPTDVGEFTLCLYHNNLDNKEHLALLVGDLDAGRREGDQAAPRYEDVMVRVHSECFTGDVLGSRRCDCGPQLAAALELIAREERGVLIYMRQEGRGIGLLEKLRAYNLQDIGFDTVDANLLLGHQADLRDYRIAAQILADLGIASVRLMTNNPDKITGLERWGLRVTERVPLQTTVHADNARYLDAKVRRMKHLLEIDAGAMDDALVSRALNHSQPAYPSLNGAGQWAALQTLTDPPPARRDRPYVTLSYAQSLDGSIAARRGEPLAISGPEAMRLTHLMRAQNDAILVGVGTVIADDPRLTVRHVRGPDPQPVVVDSRLRFPLWARMLKGERRPWIFTTDAADNGRQAALEAAGARVIRLPADPNGLVNLTALLAYLNGRHMRSLMVEGGATVISSFLTERLADRLVLTIAPRLLGGLNALDGLGHLNGRVMPRLSQPRYQALGQDMILFGELVWE